MAAGAVGCLSSMIDMMHGHMQGMKAGGSCAVPHEDMSKMMDWAQSAHEAMTGSKKALPKKDAAPRKEGVVYLEEPQQ